MRFVLGGGDLKHGAPPLVFAHTTRVPDRKAERPQNLQGGGARVSGVGLQLLAIAKTGERTGGIYACTCVCQYICIYIYVHIHVYTYKTEAAGHGQPQGILSTQGGHRASDPFHYRRKNSQVTSNRHVQGQYRRVQKFVSDTSANRCAFQKRNCAGRRHLWTGVRSTCGPIASYSGRDC